MHDTLRAGVAAILAGALIFAGQAGELVFGSSGALDIVLPLLYSCGLVALGVAVWELRRLMVSRLGRIGNRIAVAGFVFLALFAVQLLIEAIRTGDIPDNFILFALGFLLILVGQLLFARDLRHRLGAAWMLPLVATAGLIVALMLDVDPIHDIGLFIFEGAWIGLGVVLIRRRRTLVVIF
jgi:hypothetical protein